MAKNRKQAPEINASSMADIAFLLLIFFLVTTTIASDKGLLLLLPPKQEQDQPQEIKLQERNLFKILINSNDQLLVENEPFKDISRLRGMIKEFVLNNGRNPESSDDPIKAVVSLKADRGTSYEIYVEVLDEVQSAYYEIYAERAGITPDQFRNLNKKFPKEQKMYEDAREGIPMNISLAEPSEIGGK